MPKLFVISDCHGFYHEMLDALDNAGFDPNNEDHWLISCGDNFDRGPCPEDVMVYLKMLPRKILVKGNHEDLLMECINRGYNIEDESWRWEIYGDFNKSYIETGKEKFILINRIEERIKNSSKINFHYNHNKISKEEAIRILKSC